MEVYFQPMKNYDLFIWIVKGLAKQHLTIYQMTKF